MGSVDPVQKKELLRQVTEDLSSSEMRDLAVVLLRVADSIDQNWDGAQTRPGFHWPGAYTRISRDAANLAFDANVIHLKLQKRREFMPKDLVGNPGWEILLQLFIQFAGGAGVSAASLSALLNMPAETVAQHIERIEAAGLLRRTAPTADECGGMVELTEKGVVAVGSYLEQYR